jgi:hypothetical protein
MDRLRCGHVVQPRSQRSNCATGVAIVTNHPRGSLAEHAGSGSREHRSPGERSSPASVQRVLQRNQINTEGAARRKASRSTSRAPHTRAAAPGAPLRTLKLRGGFATPNISDFTSTTLTHVAAPCQTQSAQRFLQKGRVALSNICTAIENSHFEIGRIGRTNQADLSGVCAAPGTWLKVAGFDWLRHTGVLLRSTWTNSTERAEQRSVRLPASSPMIPSVSRFVPSIGVGRNTVAREIVHAPVLTRGFKPAAEKRDQHAAAPPRRHGGPAPSQGRYPAESVETSSE